MIQESDMQSGLLLSLGSLLSSLTYTLLSAPLPFLQLAADTLRIGDCLLRLSADLLNLSVLSRLRLLILQCSFIIDVLLLLLLLLLLRHLSSGLLLVTGDVLGVVAEEGRLVKLLVRWNLATLAENGRLHDFWM